MSYEIVLTSQFRKDYKLMRKRGKDKQKLEEVLRILADGGQLPPEKRDHALSGDYAGFRECHIEPDWLLIYCYLHNQLVLVCSRTGTHSDLFG
jgi:mRNA interferase YafQ